MKKIVKTLAPLALAGMMAFTACTQAPATPNTYEPIAALPGSGIELMADDNIDQCLIDHDFEFFPLPNFMHFRGRVVDFTLTITKSDEVTVEELHSVLLECPETGGKTNFFIDLQSAVFTDGEITPGMNLVGWYDSTIPVPTVWPLQHRAVALTPELPYRVLLARFYDIGGTLTCYRGINSLNITGETEIILQDGTPFEGELGGRKLLVQFVEEGCVLSPVKITVLFEVAVHPMHILGEEELAEMGIFIEPPLECITFENAIAGGPALLSPEDIEDMWAGMFDPETVQIIVLDEAIDAPAPFTCSTAGAVMLPVAAVARALGYVVTDNGSEVIIGPGTIVTEGINSYFRGREAPRELTSAPVMRDGALFVPWEFFHEILSAVVMIMDGNVYVVAQE